MAGVRSKYCGVPMLHHYESGTVGKKRHRLASDDVTKLRKAWQRGKLLLNKGSVPDKACWEKSLSLGEASYSFVDWSERFWQLLSASHFKRYWGSDKCVAVFRSIDDLQACFCMGRYLCLEPILPVARPVAGLWRSTCKPYKAVFMYKFERIGQSVSAHKLLKLNSKYWGKLDLWGENGETTNGRESSFSSFSWRFGCVLCSTACTLEEELLTLNLSTGATEHKPRLDSFVDEDLLLVRSFNRDRSHSWSRALLKPMGITSLQPLFLAPTYWHSSSP